MMPGMPTVSPFVDLAVALRKVAASFGEAGWKLPLPPKPNLAGAGQGIRNSLTAGAGAATLSALSGGDLNQAVGSGLAGAVASPVMNRLGALQTARTDRKVTEADAAAQRAQATQALATRDTPDPVFPVQGAKSAERFLGPADIRGARQAAFAAQSAETQAGLDLPAQQAAAAKARMSAGRNQVADQLLNAKGVRTGLAAATGAAAGTNRVGETAGSLATALPRAAINKFQAEPEKPWTQVLADNWPAAAALGASGILAAWLLLSDDDEKHPKTAALADPDPNGKAAKNRRRLQSLLIRHPDAVDHSGGDLHTLPVPLQA